MKSFDPNLLTKQAGIGREEREEKEERKKREEREAERGCHRLSPLEDSGERDAGEEEQGEGGEGAPGEAGAGQDQGELQDLCHRHLHRHHRHHCHHHQDTLL